MPTVPSSNDLRTNVVTARGSARVRPARTHRRRGNPTAMELISHLALALCTIAFILPLLIVVSASFTSENGITKNGYGLWPSEISTLAYRYLLDDPSQLIQSYAISILVTVVGTAISVLITSMLGYVLSRRDFAPRRPLSLFVIFTMLFSGGLVPTYILITQVLNLQNNILALILPLLIAPFNVLIIRTFVMQVPASIIEAARIDGAGEWRIFFRVALPMSTPAIATIGMFTMLVYWNDWWQGLLYISDDKLTPVQLFLYRVMGNIDAISSNPAFTGSTTGIPVQSLRMAVAVLAIGPLIIAFVFLQKYFVRGITLGGVRE
jgi:putative aldouronate transport system permease protein